MTMKILPNRIFLPNLVVLLSVPKPIEISLCISGRRIIYDYDKYGDTPACLGKQDQVLDGKIAVSQGYGLTENGKWLLNKNLVWLASRVI